MNVRGFIFAAIICLALMPTLRAQQPQEPTAVTTPAGAAAPASPLPSPNVPTSQAVPVQQVPSPAAPSHASDQVLWALIASYLLQYLKNAGWFPWLNAASTDRLKAQFGFLAALLTAAGIHFAINGSVLDDTGAAITITGVSLDALKDVGFQWASQQAWFDLIVHRRTAGR